MPLQQRKHHLTTFAPTPSPRIHKAARTPRRTAIPLCLLLLAALTLHSAPLATPAKAQGKDLRSGGLNPFPKNDIYRLHFIGDWLMNKLASSLTASLQTIQRIQVQDDIIKVQSLRHSSWQRNNSAIHDRAASQDIDIAVVMFGLSEIGSIHTPGQERQRFGSELWLKKYASRIDRFMKALKISKGAVYWVGLPIVRRREHSEGYQLINTIVRERAYANGVTYIDLFTRFQDENGGFNNYGPDLSGTIKQLRTKDGIYFTKAGKAKIGHFVLQLIRRDLARVKSERVVTLAGNETEQSSIRRSKQSPRLKTSTNKANKTTSRQIIPGSSQGGAQKANDGSVEYQMLIGNKQRKVVLKLPRPALSAAIMTLVTRNQSKDKPARFGDNAVHVTVDRIPLLSTVTPADQSALALRKRRLSPTQSVFFKVWGKGERLPPKPGRADDFQWPRPEPQLFIRARAAAKPKPKRPPPPKPTNPLHPPLPVQHPGRNDE